MGAERGLELDAPFGFLSDELEPGFAVGVGEGVALGHFGDVGGWVEVVAFDVGEPEFGVEGLGECGFARACYALFTVGILVWCLDVGGRGGGRTMTMMRRGSELSFGISSSCVFPAVELSST